MAIVLSPPPGAFLSEGAQTGKVTLIAVVPPRFFRPMGQHGSARPVLSIPPTIMTCGGANAAAACGSCHATRALRRRTSRTGAVPQNGSCLSAPRSSVFSASMNGPAFAALSVRRCGLLFQSAGAS